MSSENSLHKIEEEEIVEEFLKPLQDIDDDTAYEEQYLDNLLWEPVHVTPVQPINKQDEFAEKFAPFFFKVSGKDERVNAYELQMVMAFIFKKHFSKSEDFSLEACRSMISMMDFDRSGHLCFDEFKMLWGRIMRWKKCFEKFDGDLSVTIDRDELNSAMQDLNFELNHETLDMLIARYVNKSGTINLDDFIQICARVTSVAEDYLLFNGRNFTLDEMLLTSLYN